MRKRLTGEQYHDIVTAILRKHRAECEEAQEKYDNLPATHHIPLQTVQRKQYAIDAQITLLQTILDEIDLIARSEGSEGDAL